MTVLIALTMFVSVAIVNAKSSEITQTKRLVIGPDLVDCTGVAPQKCMQVLNPNTGKYENFFGEIKGFTFIPGSKAFIEVQEIINDPKNTPADMSNREYSLIRVIKSRSQSLSLQGSWKITAFNGENVPNPVYVSFLTGNKISAKVCNIFSGNYSLQWNTLNVSQMISTKMACVGDLGKIESAFDLTWAKILRGKDGISLTTKKGDVFILKNENMLLKNTSWKLESINGVKPINEITLNFSSKNTIGLKICNIAWGEYTLINNKFSAPNMISTLMYCDDERWVIEHDFQIDWSTYSLENNILTFITWDWKKYAWKQ